jgi:hypothetical protein
MPVRPLRHPGHLLGAGPGEAFAPDAHAVAHRLAVAEHQIKVGVRRVDDDRAGGLLGAIVDQSTLELRRQRLRRTGLGPHIRRQGGIALLHRSGDASIDLTGRDDLLSRTDRQRRPHAVFALAGRSGAAWIIRTGAGGGRLEPCRHRRSLILWDLTRRNQHLTWRRRDLAWHRNLPGRKHLILWDLSRRHGVRWRSIIRTCDARSRRGTHRHVAGRRLTIDSAGRRQLGLVDGRAATITILLHGRWRQRLDRLRSHVGRWQRPTLDRWIVERRVVLGGGRKRWKRPIG